MLKTAVAFLGIALGCAPAESPVAELPAEKPAPKERQTPPMPEESTLYFGTYTSKDGSKGIYRARLDLAKGTLSPPELVAEISNPSFLALHPAGHTLYAVNEDGVGKVSAFSIPPAGKLSFLGARNTGGAHPCHLAVDPFGRSLLTADYSSGTAACFPIGSDGSLGEATWNFKNEGSGPNKGRQEAPHMHAAAIDARSRHAYFCDLGTDEVLTFAFDNEKGTLTKRPSAKIAPGGGPRHIALHPNGRFAYVNHEMGNAVTAFSVDADSGALTELNTLSTVPKEWKGGGTAEIAVHPSGKFVFVSNRGHDSIASYRIDDDGSLGAATFNEIGVKEPRGFDIDPTGTYLVVGGQGSDNVAVLRIDGQKGSLSPVSEIKGFSKPVCVLFARPAP